METNGGIRRKGITFFQGNVMKWQIFFIVLLLGLFIQADARAFTLNVVGCDANNSCALSVSGFRWLLEEDNTNQSPPGVRVGNSIGLDIHNSHAPVVANGAAVGSTATITAPDPAKRYYISVLPDAGFALSGTQVAAGEAGTVTVKVHQYPIPTAQISVLVFKDHNLINNIPDAVEEGLSNFSIMIFDQAGQMSTDAFGNPLGTTYMPDGTVDMMGSGEIITGADGTALIKNLAPGKYGIRAVPPHNQTNWQQTSTIEGTPGIDAWVKANEPPIFIEGFGTGFHHVFIGFVDPTQLPWAVSPPAGGVTVTGQNVYNHFGKPPVNQGFVAGEPVAECWVGLNDLASAQGLIAVPCDQNSNFTINNVPPGTYQLVTWDKPLDALFGFNTVVVGNQNLDLGKVLSFRWFGTLEGSVFYDANQNGFRDPGEMPMENQNINIRFRDGSIYQFQPTDAFGEYSFAEVFPFFKWLVAEVDFTRYKATGMTTVVDDGGPIQPHNGWIMPSYDKLNPQPQAAVNPNTGNNLSRTETGPVLLEAMMLFLNQINVIDWGKAVYGPNENGGITGIVYYSVTRAENDPRYNAAETWEPGIPDVQVNLYQDFNVDGIPDGPAIGTVFTDSWDANKPTGCIQTLPPIPGVQPCYDNYGTWNQVRPGVFDGGYAFGPNLPPGTYIVEVIPPVGYQIVKEEDKNVDFGDEVVASALLLPPVCVGAQHPLPQYLALFPDQMIPNPSNDPYDPAKTAPLCDRKQIRVDYGKNAAADFHLLTEVPKAARVVGFVNNDLAAEFNAGSPIFGEKSSPSWLPVSFQDWQGNEVARVYTDEFGSYNALLPSTMSVNVPCPSGVSPNMITAILNHPLLPDGSIDPYYDPRYSVTPWTLDYWPGKTTYLDTPLVPVAALTGFPQNGPDVEPPSGTPVIKTVNGPANGPVVCAAPATVTITSMGPTAVPNPDFDPAVPGSPINVTRDYGFGATEGAVTIGNFTVSPADVNWTDSAITMTVSPGVATGQLVIRRGDNNRSTDVGVTLHVSANNCANVVHVVAGAGTPIQDAVDAAPDGSVIIVEEGNYNENVILFKNLTLQGSGAGGTKLYVNPSPANRLTQWHAKVLSIFGSDPFLANEAPGIMVLGNVPAFPASAPDLIDGLQVFGAIAGGGIYVNADTDSLKISNNKINGNQGNWGAGITVGTPDTVSVNTNLVISNNYIIKNGGIQGGGGVSIYAGADNYKITNNYLGANFSRFYGGGINHYGLSNNGLMEENRIVFNEVAFGGAAFSDGAGIFVGGEPVAAALSAGAGNVTINANLIQGNLAGVGSGAGIRALNINGADVAASPGDPSSWYFLNITNNMIVNNVAGYTGGGIALQDAAKANIVNNTIANNDSTATAANAFIAGSTDSTPQGAGIVSNVHSAALSGIAGFTQTFSNPALVNNIIWNNRSFYITNGGAGSLLPNPAGPVWDLQVTGAATPSYLNPTFSLLTSLTYPDGGNYNGASGNMSGNPQFQTSYLNTLYTAAVIDEGGNFVTVRFTPLVESSGNYHVLIGSPAINNGSNSQLALAPADYDAQTRPIGGSVDIGADEFSSGTSITVTTPNGGESWAAGSTQTIRWTYTGNPGTIVRIELFKGGVLNRTISAATFRGNGGNGSFNWTIPSNQTPGTDFVIKVTSITNAVFTDTSNTNFTISGPTIALTLPNGGENWAAGSVQTIRWTYTGNPGTIVRIELLKGGVLNRTITASAFRGNGGNGSFNWTIPSNQTPGADYKVRITSTTNATFTDMSNADFSIIGPTIAVTAPNGSETWSRSTMRTITWTYTGNPGTFVRIELLKGGIVVRTISAMAFRGNGGTGSLNYFVPFNLTQGTDYSVRITSTTNAAATDTSDNFFTVQ
jgi:large repetitive protein